MGLGDELMAAGEARALRGERRERVAVVDRLGRRRWSPVWEWCADVARPGEATTLAVTSGGKARPYIDWPASGPERWALRPYRPTPARLALPAELSAFARPWAGAVVIEPGIKAGASPNKDWGWERWRQLVALRPALPWLQLGPAGTRVLPGARFLATPSFGHALAVLAVAAAAVLPEGGLHHGAAAAGCRAVVLFGGYIAPEHTGYAGHANIFTGGTACGSRRPCKHCAEAMARITPPQVIAALEGLLNLDPVTAAPAEPPLPCDALKQVGGVWLPAGEQHLVEWMTKRNEVVAGCLTYQHHKLTAALDRVHSFRRALDVGAHCGLWSMHLARRFQAVEAFEPVALHRAAFRRNVRGAGVRLHPCALGAAAGSAGLVTEASSSGDTRLGGAGEIPVERLDALLPELADVDFVKLDCEGYELFALQGMEATLRRCRPVVIVEQKPGHAQRFGLPERGAVDWLRGLGMRLGREMSGDFIMVWE